MDQKTQKHIVYYLTFIGVEALGLLSLFFLSYDRMLQFMIICFMAAFYVGWSVLHHYHHHNITPKIVIEYILIGLLGVVIAFLIFQQ